MRTRLCVTCRTLLADEEPCRDGHDVASLRDHDHRRRLRTAIWGDAPPKHRDGTLRGAVIFSVQMSVVIAATLAVMVAMSRGCDDRVDLGSLGLWAGVGVVWLLLSIAIAWEIFTGDGVRLRRPHRVPPPRGASAPAIEGAGAGRGPARGTATASISGRPCLAWSISLERDGDVFLHDARTAGFTIESDAGRIEVPAGRVTLGAPRRAVRRRDVFRALPGVADGDTVPFTEAWEATLADGDVVEILGELEQVPGGGYREAAVLRPVGVATLRRV